VTDRSVLLVDAGEALRHPGTRRSMHRTAVVPDLALSSVRVPADAAVDLDLSIEAIGADVVVTGTVRAPWVGECRRCLEPVEGEVVLQVREIFEREPTEGQTYPILDEERLDLEPLVRENVLLGLPLSTLCRPDCAGPDPERFPAGPAPDDPDEPEKPPAPPRDPRWAALDQLRLDG